MKRLFQGVLSCLLLSAGAWATPLELSAIHTDIGGISHWTISYDAGPAGTRIESINLNMLPPNVYLDISSNDPGAGGFHDFLTTGSDNLGDIVVTPFFFEDGNHFTDISYGLGAEGFFPGEQHQFTMDVDIFSCGSDCDTVNGARFNGAIIQFLIDGPDWDGPYLWYATFRDGATLGLDPNSAYAELDSTHMPEPATWALMGVGLVALGLIGRRRQKRQ